MAPDAATNPGTAFPKPVIDRSADWRRNHRGLYVLPAMAITVSAFLLFDEVTSYRVLAGFMGVLSIVVNYLGGRVVKTWQVFVLLPLAVTLAFAAFWFSGLA
ncbi:hypothetical protein [Saccharopolyspora dendranthemae]|uniref:Uncharacterized protein n=1 Tax=Saccharopolyspora dendranthemae TaxID=1181886 RepID=A0A561U2L9_9PSEU|nr:hypothetical protein [Saccharopolyspora dendranthemae]TWF93624.1 hypothetical protein FHU35_15478 [Saccharopolyspora dendranthemae]